MLALHNIKVWKSRLLQPQGVLKKFWVRMCGWKFQLPPNSKTTDEPNLQAIFKPNILFYPPINQL